MTLTGLSKLFKHGKANTLYLSIPSMMAQDSIFPFKSGDTLKINVIFREAGPYLIVEKVTKI